MVQFGIWVFDEKSGLVGRPKDLPEVFIRPDRIWDIKETTQGQVWKWPLKFASQPWFTPREADDFNKAFFYAHKFFKGFPSSESAESFDIDARTIQIQTELLSDYFPGPDGEVGVRA